MGSKVSGFYGFGRRGVFFGKSPDAGGLARSGSSRAWRRRNRGATTATRSGTLVFGESPPEKKKKQQKNKHLSHVCRARVCAGFQGFEALWVQKTIYRMPWIVRFFGTRDALTEIEQVFLGELEVVFVFGGCGMPDPPHQ